MNKKTPLTEPGAAGLERPMRGLVVAAVALSCSAGCGYSDAGGGSRTILATVSARYDAGLENRLTLHATLERDGAPVSGATVQITDDKGHALATLADASGHNQRGDYRGETAGYHRRLALTITAPEGHLEAKLEGPGPHEITAPLHEAALSGRDQLGVQWRVDDGLRADQVIVTLDGGRQKSSPDDGSVSLDTHDVAMGGHSLTVTRRNSIELAGGAATSSFTFDYVVSNDFVFTD
jgi:hypothetical protein